MICFILQGSKQVAINNDLLIYDPEHYLISAIDLPLIGQILGAEGGQPYVAVALDLDSALLTDVASTMPEVRAADPQSIGIATYPMTAPLRDTLLRPAVVARHAGRHSRSRPNGGT